MHFMVYSAFPQSLLLSFRLIPIFDILLIG